MPKRTALYGQEILPMFSNLVYKQPHVQLDTFATCSIDGHARPAVFTLWFGTDTPSDPRSSSAAMRIATADREWICIGFVKGRFGLAPGTNEAGRRVLEAIRCNERSPILEPLARASSSGVQRPLPTALCFARTRNGWASKAGIDHDAKHCLYSPAKLISLDEAGVDRIAGQLKALARADRGRFDRLLGLLNEFAVFDGTPRAVVTRLISDRIVIDKGGRWSHAISKLGSGEAALIGAYATLALNATEAMLTMIDGIDAWTDTTSRERLIRSLISLNATFPRQMMILTTSDLDFFHSTIDGAHRSGLSSDGIMLSSFRG